jgi:hypothetical protein
LEHPVPLFLLGSDVLRGGRPATAWNFNGLTQRTENNTVVGRMQFEKNGCEVSCPLLFCPTSEGKRFTTPGYMTT